MKSSTKDELKGKTHTVTGTIKETAGRIINNPDLEAKGQKEKLAGKIQEKLGQVERVIEQ